MTVGLLNRHLCQRALRYRARRIQVTGDIQWCFITTRAFKGKLQCDLAQNHYNCCPESSETRYISSLVNGGQFREKCSKADFVTDSVSELTGQRLYINKAYFK
jgi:hypothetical protein